jgi:hypothetical protein
VSWRFVAEAAAFGNAAEPGLAARSMRPETPEDGNLSSLLSTLVY